MALILRDVNVWVYAFRQDSPYHTIARNDIERDIENGVPFIFSRTVASSFLRIVTNQKIFVKPSSLGEAWGFVDVLAEQPEAIMGDIDEMTFGLFKHMSFVHDICGNQIPDAMLAALAMRYDAELRTFDRGFAKYKGLNFAFLGTTA